MLAFAAFVACGIPCIPGQLQAGDACALAALHGGKRADAGAEQPHAVNQHVLAHAQNVATYCRCTRSRISIRAARSGGLLCCRVAQAVMKCKQFTSRCRSDRSSFGQRRVCITNFKNFMNKNPHLEDSATTPSCTSDTFDMDQ